MAGGLTLPTRRRIFPPYSVALASPAAPPHRAHRGICRATATGAFIIASTWSPQAAQACPEVEEEEEAAPPLAAPGGRRGARGKGGRGQRGGRARGRGATDAGATPAARAQVRTGTRSRSLHPLRYLARDVLRVWQRSWAPPLRTARDTHDDVHFSWQAGRRGDRGRSLSVLSPTAPLPGPYRGRAVGVI